MRAAFGLVSLLVCGLIVAYLWASYTKPVASAGKVARAEAKQIAGRNEDGTPAADSATFAPVEKSGGQLYGARVTSVDPAGAMAQHFGLAVGDVVLKVGMFNVGESLVDDIEGVRNTIGTDAYRASWDLVVDRGGQQITLPAGRNTALTPAAAVAAAPTTNPAAPPVNPNPQSQQPKNARGAAEDLVNQLNRSQNRGD